MTEAPAAPELDAKQARRIDLAWSAGMGGACLSVFLLLSLARGAALPVLISLALAYVLDPLVRRLEQRGLRRSLAVLAIFGASAVAATAFLLYLAPALRAEVQKLPGFVSAFSDRVLPRAARLLGVDLPDNLRELARDLSARGGALAQKLLPNAASMALNALAGTASLLSGLLGLAMIPVLAFFFMRDFDSLLAQARALLPLKARPLLSSRFQEVDQVLGAFVRGQLSVGAILSLIYAAGLSLAHLDLALVIGLIAGFGNMVPYLGTGLGIALSLLALAVSWQGSWQLAAVAATFAVAQGLEGLVLTPRIVGSRVGLGPLEVLVAVLLFGELFGFAGIMLAVPTAAALKVVARVLVKHYRSSSFFLREPS